MEEILCNVLFKSWKSPKLENECFHPTMMKCREIIIVDTSLTGGVQKECFSFPFPIQAEQAGESAHTLWQACFVKPFLNWITESSPDLSVMSVCPSCRYVGDAGDSYRCWWPHLRQQCQAGVQHTAGTTVFLCGASDRWGWKQNPGLHLQTSTSLPNTCLKYITCPDLGLSMDYTQKGLQV